MTEETYRWLPASAPGPECVVGACSSPAATIPAPSLYVQTAAGEALLCVSASPFLAFFAVFVSGVVIFPFLPSLFLLVAVDPVLDVVAGEATCALGLRVVVLLHAPSVSVFGLPGLPLVSSLTWCFSACRQLGTGL